MVTRRGTFVYASGEHWPRICLTLTGARILTWRLRRAERDAARTERKMNRAAGLDAGD